MVHKLVGWVEFAHGHGAKDFAQQERNSNPACVYCHLPTDGEEPINEGEMTRSVKKKGKKKKVLGKCLMKYCD